MLAMTSQAERIKAFKLAQHARLRKQEDEDQWISSEELCTEGSSDEETHTNTTHRKLKRNKPQKRGISPLAQVPKKESSSSHLAESNYLLPEPQLSSHSMEISEQLHYDKLDKSLDESKSYIEDSRNSDSEESIDESEIEKMIQWRPKRGSIKLPDFSEGHNAYDASNAFYTEMALIIRRLKQKPLKSKSYLFPDIDEKEKNEVMSKPKINRKHSDIFALMAKVSKLDSMISESSLLYEKAKEERIVVQDEMCKVILNDLESPTTLNKNLQNFIDLCHFETREVKEAEDAVELCEPQSKVHFKSGDKNFINRNIQLAKQYSMAQCSLTDEEKIKLESLLSDADSERDSETSQKSVVYDNPDVKKTSNEVSDFNYFKMQSDDASVMKNLSAQLEEILQSYEGDENKLTSLENIEEDALQSADQESKLWKHNHLQERLESIQKSLNQIATKDAEEQKKLKSIYGNSENTDYEN